MRGGGGMKTGVPSMTFCVMKRSLGYVSNDITMRELTVVSFDDLAQKFRVYAYKRGFTFGFASPISFSGVAYRSETHMLYLTPKLIPR